MDPVANPYTPNAGSPPAELAGREEQLEQFRVLVERLKRGATDQSMVVRGPRGVGKTVLLNAFESRAESVGFLTYYHELTPDSSLIEALARDTGSALVRLSLTQRLAARVRSTFARLKTLRLTAPEGFEVAVELGGSNEGTITADLTELFLEIGAVAKEQDTGIAFFLDEVQFVREVEYRALISALHRCTQKQLPITAAAAGLPQIPRLSGEARSYAERLFTFPEIANLEQDAAASAFTGPASREGVEFDRDALDEAIRWTQGYPFYIQQLGKHVWNRASASPINVDTVTAAEPAAQHALDTSIYQVRLQRSTPAERQYMRAMSTLGTGPYKSGDVAGQAGRSVNALSPVREALLTKGLIYATEDYGYLDFTIPRFDEFLRRAS